MVAMPDHQRGWRKSSYSGGSGTGDCVEIAFVPDNVAIRDSKNPRGPRLAFTPVRWRSFVQRMS